MFYIINEFLILENSMNLIRISFFNIRIQRCMHYSESDLINNTDHMSISGTEPSPVILLPIFVHNALT